MANCCERILGELERLQAYGVSQNQNIFPALDDIFNLPPTFVPVPSPIGGSVPNLAELLNRIRTPLDSGFGEWWWYNKSQPGKISLVLPKAPDPDKTRVAINSVQLPRTGEYTIVGTLLTFTYPLDVGDLVWVKSYGEAT